MKSMFDSNQPMVMIAIKTEMTQHRFAPDDLLFDVLLYFLKQSKDIVIILINTYYPVISITSPSGLMDMVSAA